MFIELSNILLFFLFFKKEVPLMTDEALQALKRVLRILEDIFESNITFDFTSSNFFEFSFLIASLATFFPILEKFPRSLKKLLIYNHRPFPLNSNFQLKLQ